MKKAIRILIVEDKPDEVDLAKYEIRKTLRDCEFQIEETREGFMEALKTFQPDVILADYTLPHFDGMKALKLTLHHAPLTPFIIWTGAISEDVAVDCVKAGANNYIIKDNLKRLGPAILRALEERELLVARRQAEQRYQNIFEHSIEGIFQSSPQGRYLNVNPAMARLYGYDSPKEMIESIRNIATQIYVESDRRSAFMGTLNSWEKIENFEARNYRKDGSIIWTSTSARVVRDQNGAVLYYEGFTQDITQRKTAEEALLNSEKRFRALIENGLDDISLLAADGTLLWESPSTIRNLGYAPNEFVGHNIFTLMHPEDLEWTGSAYAKLLKEPGSRQRGIFRLRRSDGTWRWVEAIATNMLSEPAVNATVINYRDITDQKQAEIELQQRNEDLALVNALNETINQGSALATAMNLLREEVKRIFSSQYTNIYLLDQDGQSIKMQDYALPPEVISSIEKLIRRTIPSIEIPVQEHGVFQSVMRSGHGVVINDPESIHKWIGEFAETASLSPLAKAAIRKLVPQIHKILNIKSTILVPLIADGKTLGLLNVSGPNILTDQDLKRIEHICGQLTTALRRKQMEDALRESQARYQNLVETSHDLIWSVDTEGRFTYINRASKEIYGYEPEELIGRSFFEVLDPEYYHTDLKTFKETIAIADEFREFEIYIRHRDGRQIILSSNSIVLHDEHGNFTGVTGSSHDITIRKRVEDVLKEERNLLRTLIDNIPDRIYAMDLQGRKTLSNIADWKASGGKTMEDVIGKTDFDTYPPELAEEFWKLDKAVLDSGQPVINYEEPGLDEDGNFVSILTSKIPLRDDQGNMIGLVGIGRDITERKETEEKLRRSESQYRLATKATNDVIWEWDPKTNQLLWSENAQHVFGYLKEEIGPNEKWWDDHIHPDDRSRILTKLNALISGSGSIWMDEYRFRLKDGSYAHISDRGYVEREEDGTPLRMIGAMSDITLRKKAEIERQALLEIMQGLANTRDLQELLKLIQSSIAKVIYAENFLVILYQPTTGLFEEIYSVDQYDPPAPPAKLENSITSYVFRSGEPLLLTRDSFEELARRGEVTLVGTDSASWLGVPLKTSGRTIGMIAVQDYENDNRYSENDKDFLASIATQVALVIERKRAEESLHQSEALYRRAIEVAGAVPYYQSYYDEGKFINYEFIGEGIRQITGYGPEEFNAALWDSLVEEINLVDELAGYSLEEGIQRVRTGKNSTWKCEHRIRARDGKIHWVFEAAVELRDENGISYGSIGTYQDITERKEAEEALRESEEHYRTIFGGVQDAIFVESLDGKILMVNERACEMFGYSQAEFLTKTVADLIPPGVPVLTAEGIELSAEPRETFNRRASGEVFPIEISGRIQVINGENVLLVVVRDITERKRSEDLLRESEERFSGAFEYASIGMALVAPNGAFVRVNWALCWLLGYSETELLQKTFQDLTYPDDLQEDLDRVDKLLSGEIESYQIEKRYFHKQGHVVWALLSVSLVQDNQGKPQYFISQIQDITERKQVEESLRAERRKAEKYLEIAGVTMLALDREGTVTLINQKGCEILGYSADQIIGKNWTDTFLPEGTREEMREVFKKLISEEIPSLKYYENPILTKNGEQRLIAWHNTLLRDEQGRILSTLSSGEDITERKQVETALRESVTQFRTLFEASPDAIVLIDPNQDWTIIDCNTVACQLNGYTREELLGQSIDVLSLTPGDATERTEYMERVRQHGVLHYETPHRRKDGTVFTVDVSTSLITFGTRDLILGIDRDVTERKRAEEEIRRRAEETAALLQTSLALTSLDLESTLQTIGNSANNLFLADGCRIFLVESDGKTLRCVLALEENIFAFSNLRIEIGQGVTGAVAASGRAEIVNEMQNDPRALQVVGTEEEREAIMFAPLKERERVIGILSIRRVGGERPFQPADLELLEAFASMTASAVSNARLFEETQRRLSELNASEERFRQLADNIQEAFWMTDAETGRELYMSPAVETIWGRSVQSMMYEPNAWINSVFTEDRPTLLDAVEREKNGEKMQFEYRIVRPDGTLRWIWDRAFPIFDEAGKVKRIAGITADITERRESELALAKSQNRYRELFDSSPISIWEEDFSLVKKQIAALQANGVTDVKTYLSSHPEFVRKLASLVKITDVNKASLELYGVDHKADLLQSLGDILDDTALKHFENEILSLMSPLRRFSWEGQDATRIGKRLEVLVQGSIPSGYEGDWSKVIVSIIDITERKEAAEKLRESEERYHSLFQNQRHGSALYEIITDEQGQALDYVFLKVNPAFEKMTGLSSQELVGRRITEVLPGIENQSLIEVYGQVALTGKPAHLSEYVAPLGKYYEISAYAAGPQRFAVSFLDITERRQAEQELRKLSRAVEHSGSTIVVTDTSGNIEYVNPKFTEVTGYTFEEAIGKNPRFLKSGFTPQEDYEQLWQTITSGREWHGEFLNRKKNGTLFWESVTISPILNDHREITHFVGVKEDITERKQNEIETRRHLAELEAVYENGLSVGRLLEPNEIGNRVIETFARYLPWHHVTIRLRKEGHDDLELVSFNLPNLKEEERLDAEQHFIARVNKVGQGLSGWAIETGMPLRTGNVHAHPQYIDTHAGIQSGLYMPLKVADRIIGVISVESEVPNAFTEQDERLLATLANQTAIAFENARLYEAMQKELSERKRAEDALRISETHYRALADSITDILFELDQDLHFTHWNKASETLTGVPARDAIGKSMEGILGKTEEQARIKAIYEQVLQHHQPKTFETTIVIGGENRSFEVNAYPSMRGVSVVAKDVTDRKRTETIMQKRFELMEYAAKHSLNELMLRTVDEVSELTDSEIGFFHFMAEDQRHLGLQTWSTSALQLFHVDPTEGGHHPLDEAGVWAEAVRKRCPLIQNDYESLAKKQGVPQGHVTIVREMVIPIIRNERIMAVMGIGNKPQDYTPHDLEVAARLADYAWDITERKQMEIALEVERNQLVQRVEERTADLSRANSNLARALRVKDEFLANMSHELRTPLNAILGLSESLGEQIAGPLNEKQQKYISTISESGHHLLSLINDILDLAKIDAGQITVDINKVDIHSVCQASLRMIKQLAQKKNQEVSLEIDHGLGLMWADERRLKQMIVNLLGNAVKFTPENGKLGLEVHGGQEANQIAITVWDNGIGIKQEDLARLFQPFVQLDSGLAREATGTGLGLALVAQMARLHGGSVNAVSEAGKGSRFTIILPWEPALAIDTASRMKITGKFRAIQVDEKNKPTILLVEDTKEVVMMLKDYLELAGYRIFTAQDGIDGLVQARHVRPDLILMDVQMPGMDGFETTRKLRSDPSFRYTPIIALTALAMPHDRERCLEAGMDEYISKPVNLKALIKVIQGCLFEQESRTR